LIERHAVPRNGSCSTTPVDPRRDKGTGTKRPLDAPISTHLTRRSSFFSRRLTFLLVVFSEFSEIVLSRIRLNYALAELDDRRPSSRGRLSTWPRYRPNNGSAVAIPRSRGQRTSYGQSGRRRGRYSAKGLPRVFKVGHRTCNELGAQYDACLRLSTRCERSAFGVQRERGSSFRSEKKRPASLGAWLSG